MNYQSSSPCRFDFVIRPPATMVFWYPSFNGIKSNKVYLKSIELRSRATRK